MIGILTCDEPNINKTSENSTVHHQLYRLKFFQVAPVNIDILKTKFCRPTAIFVLLFG